MDVDVAEEDATPLKKQKVMERCKFWPVCKSGDECLYHHPTTQCKWVFLFINRRTDNGVFIALALTQSLLMIFFHVFYFSEGLFPAVSSGINAFLSIQIVNTMPGVPSQTVPSLTSAAEAQLLLRRPGQVFSHYLCDSTHAV